MDLIQIGSGVCLAGSGALVLAALRGGRSTQAAGPAPAAYFHVSDVEEVSPTASVLESAGLYSGCDHDVEFRYCAAEFRVTAHIAWGDGVPRCWHCPEDNA